MSSGTWAESNSGIPELVDRALLGDRGWMRDHATDPGASSTRRPNVATPHGAPSARCIAWLAASPGVSWIHLRQQIRFWRNFWPPEGRFSTGMAF